LSYASAGQPSNRVTTWQSNGRLEAFVFPPALLPIASRLRHRSQRRRSPLPPPLLRHSSYYTSLSRPFNPPAPKKSQTPAMSCRAPTPGDERCESPAIGPKIHPKPPANILTMRNRRTHPTPTDSAPWERSCADDCA